MRKAAFLDRDGTLIHDAHYLSRPEQIEWLPGVFDDLKYLQEEGYLLVVITNQSGIGRDYFSEDEYDTVKNEFIKQALDEGIRFAGIYHCPHWPESDGPCDCRKPGTELFERAAKDHDIDFGSSLAVGDRERDVEPALHLGVPRTFVIEKNKGLNIMMKNLKANS